MAADLLRHLHVFDVVAECGGIRPSSGAMVRTPATVTRAIAKLERMLEVPLFERSSHGLRLTAAGGVTWARARRIRAELAQVHRQASAYGPVAGLPALYNERRLALAVSLAQLGRMPQVARNAQISQPAVSQGITHLEADLGQQIFVRGVARMAPTEQGGRWVQRFARVLEELEGLRQDLGKFALPKW
ncbi:LysR family transcriptional regulator [Pseudoduganella sp. FT26W]|uniref:LysR family transcriptional regulator n=1 Tax=Duganella aquatilis TaxID=2666082 RepID=A0A844DC28_9BURK|nr:LysR family transcriptional regulator [Duganella aquatilis]MRW86522.1 LysR family transcriptional regulator [Duganella aquatilis]